MPRHVSDLSPLDPHCDCAVCTTVHARAYLAHLFRAEEMLGPRLLSYHNLYLVNALMRDARAAIEAARGRRSATARTGYSTPA